MSRDIKFRAWDTQLKEWTGITMGTSGVHENLYQTFSPVVFNGQGKCVIQQYTGLKDKNGVEIYEGDIITIVDKASEYTERVSREKFGRFTVEWSDVLAGWMPKSHNGYEPDETWWQTWEVEVIGNIHENPELLEQKWLTLTPPTKPSEQNGVLK